jgi:hypothetical protein
MANNALPLPLPPPPPVSLGFVPELLPLSFRDALLSPAVTLSQAATPSVELTERPRPRLKFVITMPARIDEGGWTVVGGRRPTPPQLPKPSHLNGGSEFRQLLLRLAKGRCF